MYRLTGVPTHHILYIVMQLNAIVYIFIPAIVKSPLAGDFISLECKRLMEEENIEVVPPYMIASKVS